MGVTDILGDGWKGGCVGGCVWDINFHSKGLMDRVQLAEAWLDKQQHLVQLVCVFHELGLPSSISPVLRSARSSLVQWGLTKIECLRLAVSARLRLRVRVKGFCLKADLIIFLLYVLCLSISSLIEQKEGSLCTFQAWLIYISSSGFGLKHGLFCNGDSPIQAKV